MARILLIDDEAEVMGGTLRGLKRAGHSVDTATNGAEALRKLRKGKDGYEVYILDFRLPRGKPDGQEDAVPKMEPEDVGEHILEAITKTCEEAAVIAFTGTRSDLEGITKPKNCALLRKPVLIGELLNAIEQLMSGGGMQ